MWAPSSGVSPGPSSATSRRTWPVDPVIGHRGGRARRGVRRARWPAGCRAPGAVVRRRRGPPPGGSPPGSPASRARRSPRPRRRRPQGRRARPGPCSRGRPSSSRASRNRSSTSAFMRALSPRIAGHDPSEVLGVLRPHRARRARRRRTLRPAGSAARGRRRPRSGAAAPRTGAAGPRWRRARRMPPGCAPSMMLSTRARRPTSVRRSSPGTRRSSAPAAIASAVSSTSPSGLSPMRTSQNPMSRLATRAAAVTASSITNSWCSVASVRREDLAHHHPVAVGGPRHEHPEGGTAPGGQRGPCRSCPEAPASRQVGHREGGRVVLRCHRAGGPPGGTRGPRSRSGARRTGPRCGTGPTTGGRHRCRGRGCHPAGPGHHRIRRAATRWPARPTAASGRPGRRGRT